MAPSSLLTTLLTLLTLTSATSITFHNTSPNPICYMVEISAGTFPTSTQCGAGAGISIAAGQTTTFNPSSNFNGALTAFLNNGNTRGARYELNFAGSGTWYDADYQLGMSDGTVGPADNRRLSTGQSAVSGEPDCLAKANAAWAGTANKAELLAYPDYLKVGGDGRLSFVYCDAQAPDVVVKFFQVNADFTAYVGPGSVAGVTPTPGQAQEVKMADMRSLVVDTQDMVIVAY